MRDRRTRHHHWAIAGPALLAGLLQLDPGSMACWPWSGGWVFPVGDPYDFTIGAEPSEPGYRVNRNLAAAGHGSHRGADLSNRQAAGPVRAAAHGIVVLAEGDDLRSGYGCHVVLAHRLPDGTLLYTVYAHLAPRSLGVRTGEPVRGGQLLGRVGQSGRATSAHLHFEVRLPQDPGERWEKVPAVDPVAFVASHLSDQRADSTWARPYLLWAEDAGLIGSGAEGHRPLTRSEWWRMLAAATCHDDSAVAGPDPVVLETLLVRAAVVDRRAGGPRRSVKWSEVVRDLERARSRGLRLPSSPVTLDPRTEACQQHLGLSAPAADLEALVRRSGRPTRAELCLLMADLAGDAPAPRHTAKSGPD
jgi:hypothetical protein